MNLESFNWKQNYRKKISRLAFEAIHGKKKMILLRCTECNSTSLLFDVYGAKYNPITRLFTACLGEESECECLDCGATRMTAKQEDVDE